MVIGYTAGLLLFCFSLVLFIRSHRLRATMNQAGYQDVKELDATRAPVELHGDTSPAEVDGSDFLGRDQRAFSSRSPGGKDNRF